MQLCGTPSCKVKYLESQEMNQSRAKTILKYVLPTVLSQCAFFLFAIIDGIFVGHGVGTDALGAVNLAQPFVMVVGADTAATEMALTAIPQYGWLFLFAAMNTVLSAYPYISGGNTGNSLSVSKILTAYIGVIVFPPVMIFQRHPSQHFCCQSMALLS